MSLAKSYAKALFETAKASSTPVEPIEIELLHFVDAIEGQRDAHIALYSPLTTVREKMSLVEAISQKMGLSDLTRRFLAIVARKERVAALRDMTRALTAARLLDEGGVEGILVSAESRNATDVEGLATAFSKKLDKKVVFRFETDPALLAGVKVTVNGVTYDATLRSQLQRLRDQVAAGVSN